MSEGFDFNTRRFPVTHFDNKGSAHDAVTWAVVVILASSLSICSSDGSAGSSSILAGCRRPTSAFVVCSDAGLESKAVQDPSVASFLGSPHPTRMGLIAYNQGSCELSAQCGTSLGEKGRLKSAWCDALQDNAAMECNCGDVRSDSHFTRVSMLTVGDCVLRERGVE